MCLNPQKISRNGIYKETNYNGLKGEEYYITVYSKCGRCEQCMNEKANNWVIRNYYESQNTKKAAFITLTYADNPKILIKKHLQDFFKRFRRHLEYHYNIKNIRYFGCGEYGTLRGRPHYHAIIYNWEEKEKNLELAEINKKGNICYFSKTLNDTWKFGRSTYQTFDIHEIPYITLYQSAREEEKRDFIISKEKTKAWLKELKEKKQSTIHRKILIKNLEKELKKEENAKAKYLTFKEFNTWSIALGFEKYYEQYCREEQLGAIDFNVYIEDKEFLVPSAWVKKIANWGDIHATREMQRRMALLTSNPTEEEEKNANRIKNAYKKIKDKIKFQKQKDKIIM